MENGNSILTQLNLNSNSNSVKSRSLQKACLSFVVTLAVVL